MASKFKEGPTLFIRDLEELATWRFGEVIGSFWPIKGRVVTVMRGTDSSRSTGSRIRIQTYPPNFMISEAIPVRQRIFTEKKRPRRGNSSSFCGVRWKRDAAFRNGRSRDPDYEWGVTASWLTIV